MAKYYYLGTYLPDLSFDERPDMSFAELDLLLKDHLSIKDYQKVLAIRKFFDILNLRSFWLKEPLDVRGYLAEKDLEEALISRTHLPDYVFEFMDKYTKEEERLHRFSFLLSKFFQEAEKLDHLFLRDYFRFERELRLVLTAFRAQKLKKSLSHELQDEDPYEELIAQLLAQQDANRYEPPAKYQEIKKIFEEYGDQPFALQKALDEYRFVTIENINAIEDPFSIEHILAYVIQFLLVDKWFDIDETKGNQLIETLVKEQ